MALVNSTCDETDTRVNTLEVYVKAQNQLVSQLKISSVVSDINVAVKSKFDSNKRKIKKRKKKNGDATSDKTEPLAITSQKKNEYEPVTCAKTAAENCMADLYIAWRKVIRRIYIDCLTARVAKHGGVGG